MKNRYVKRSRISEATFRKFLRHVAADLTATQIAQLTGLNRNTVNRLLRALRVRMAEACEEASPFRGEVEVDESYFGPKRVRGRRGRGAGRKTPVFGVFKRNGKVYTELVPDCSKAVLQKVIRGRVDLQSVIHSDGWRGYDRLVDLGYAKHLRGNHGQGEIANDRSLINGIESFWAFAKHRLIKFKGVLRHTFYLHQKATEFCFNHRHDNLNHVVLKLFRKQPI